MTEGYLQVADRSRMEQAAMNRVVERLTRQFPELTQETIADLVHGKYDTFHDSKIRDFVPILVERDARDQLAHGEPARHRA